MPPNAVACRRTCFFGLRRTQGGTASVPPYYMVDALCRDYDANNLHRLIYVTAINVLIDIDIEQDTENSRKLVGRHACGAAECGGSTLEEM